LKTFFKTDKEYPELLRGIKDAPKKIYCKGNCQPEIFQNCLAVVGSRRLTSYGKRVAEQIVGEIAAAGVTIVSGFMYGGDAVAHKAALTVGGKTIAVMPCGIDRISPAYQEDLYNEILDNNGLIISEYEKDMMPALWTYPKRNRIVAGLSQAVLVIEAGLESGTLITADLAKKFDRKIFAIPGPITSEVSKGTLKLIKEGAEVATCAKDVLDCFRSNSDFPDRSGSKLFSRFTLSPSGSDATSKSSETSLGSLEEKIINELKLEALNADDLARKLGVRVSELGQKLSIMQIKGQIQQEGNKYYI
jgi:DNA processing protein